MPTAMSSAQPASQTAKQPDDDTPAWMRDMPSMAVDAADAGNAVDLAASADQSVPKDRFDRMLENVGKANQPREIRDTGVLDPTSLPDWLNAVGDEDQPVSEASADTLAGAVSAPDLASDSGWLSDMGLQAPEPSAAPAGEELAPGQSPDWLTNIVPGAKSAPTPAEALPLDSLDFSSLVAKPAAPAPATADSGQADWLSSYDPLGSAASASSAPVSADNTFDRVAQPENLVNTNAQSSGSSFSFDHTPAWMRKKKSAGSKPVPAQDDDLPDWLKD